MLPYVKSSTEEGITTIEFYHPQSNSLPGNLLRELAQAINNAGSLTDSNVVLLRSGGEGAFCAGASFDELMAIDDEERSEQFFLGFAGVINAIRTIPKFVVARVHGKCVGGGVGIACAADYALALDTAAVKLSELSIGIGPFVISPAVERKMGKAAFSALAINATQWQSASWAAEKGMYAELHSTPEQLDAAVNKLIVQLAHSNAETIKELKKILWEGTEHWDELLQQRAKTVSKLAISKTVKDTLRKFKK